MAADTGYSNIAGQTHNVSKSKQTETSSVDVTISDLIYRILVYCTVHITYVRYVKP